MSNTLVYKDHAIIAAGKRDEVTGKYRPVIDVSWHDRDRRRKTDSFSLPDACETFEEARARAVTAAKAWVDRRLNEQGS
jgi:hypothetical protein